MSTQMAVLLGSLAGVGLLMVISALTPNHPNLAVALGRMNPSTNLTRRATARPATVDRKTRIGAWSDRKIARWTQLRVPERDLSLMQVERSRHIGDKVIGALVGFAVPYVVAAAAGMVGLSITAIAPLASVGVAALGWFGPDLEIRRDANTARAAFRADITTYIDLVAQERRGGAGIAGALNSAATIGDSPAFLRLKEELNRAQFTGMQPWDALSNLAEQVAIPEIAELAATMQLAGTRGSATYDQLRAQAATMRRAQLAEQAARAGAATERLQLPTAMLGLVFLTLVAAPALLSVAGS